MRFFLGPSPLNSASRATKLEFLMATIIDGQMDSKLSRCTSTIGTLENQAMASYHRLYYHMYNRTTTGTVATWVREPCSTWILNETTMACCILSVAHPGMNGLIQLANWSENNLFTGLCTIVPCSTLWYTNMYKYDKLFSLQSNVNVTWLPGRGCYQENITKLFCWPWNK